MMGNVVENNLKFFFNESWKKEGFSEASKENLLAYHYMFRDFSEVITPDIQMFLEEKDMDHFLNAKTIISNKDCLLHCLEQIDLSDLPKKELFVDKKLVHKSSQENVMVSGFELPINTKIELLTGSINCTSEIKLDHTNEEHVEAILLTELCRQSSLVSLSKILDSDSEYYIIEEFRKFKHIVKRGGDILIHALPVIGKKSRGRGLCLFTIFQDSKLCLSGYYSILYGKKKVCCDA